MALLHKTLESSCGYNGLMIWSYHRGMGIFVGLLILGWARPVCAACHPGVEDLSLRQAVAQDDYDKALAIVLKDLPIAPEERQHFHIVKGLSAHIGDSHGQSDPDTGDTQIDPGLLEEGESGACQGAMHELTHLRRFRADRNRLKVYYTSHAPSQSGWTGCASTETPSKPVERAYDCLEENVLTTHAATAEIEAVLAQRPYAYRGILRYEDVAYLKKNLRDWTMQSNLIRSTSNEGYYLPVIKKEDIRFYCRGLLLIREIGSMDRTLKRGWGEFCSSEKLKQQ
jgi:hypothetical protein